MAKARLGSTYEALSGRLGNAIAANQQDGTELRAHNPISKQPFTPKQLAREAAFTKANQTWTTLDSATVSLFRTYAATQRVRNSLTGKYRTRGAKNVFVGMYAKLLQVSASSGLPQIPVGPFVAPEIAVQVQAQTGRLVFTGSASTTANVRLEGLYQRLPSRNALPQANGYLTAAIGSLEAGDGNELDAPVAPGFYACAFRWVDATTGLDTPVVPLPMMTVGFAVAEGGLPDEAEAKKAA